jgi:hypothetical protein
MDGQKRVKDYSITLHCQACIIISPASAPPRAKSPHTPQSFQPSRPGLPSEPCTLQRTKRVIPKPKENPSAPEQPIHRRVDRQFLCYLSTQGRGKSCRRCRAGAIHEFSPPLRILQIQAAQFLGVLTCPEILLVLSQPLVDSHKLHQELQVGLVFIRFQAHKLAKLYPYPRV